MIAKVCRRGASARGLLRYLTGDSKTSHELLDDADAERLDAPSALRPDIDRPVWHCALSLPAGERLTPDQWRAVADDFVHGMGLYEHERSVVVHNETDHQHAHIVVNRINWAGEVWAGEWDGKRAIRTAKELEQVHGLAVDHHVPTGRAALTQPEIEQALRTGTQPARATLQDLIDRTAQGRGFDAFARELEQHGVQVLANVASTGRVSGLAFGYDGTTWRGSQLGKAYGWKQLQQRVGYEQERDSAAVHARARGGSRGNEERAAAGRPDSGGARRAGTSDARDCPTSSGRTEADNSARQGKQRSRDTERQDVDSNRRRTDPSGKRMGPDRHEDAASTVRPSSALARSRGPVSGAWERIQHIAAALRARFSEPTTASHGHDRHGPARAPGHRTLAAISAEHER